MKKFKEYFIDEFGLTWLSMICLGAIGVVLVLMIDLEVLSDIRGLLG